MKIINIKDGAIKICLFVIIFLSIFLISLSKMSILQYTDFDYYKVDQTHNNNSNIKTYKRGVDISFDFKFYGFKNSYENLFQTSSLDNGIRVELANASTGLWGIVVAGENGKFQVVELGGDTCT